MSKNRQIISLFVFALLLVVGCSLLPAKNTDTSNPSTGETQEDLSEATAGPAASESSQAFANNPCNNIFYPLNPGNQWVYKLNSGTSETATPEPEDTSDQIGITVASVTDNQATLDALDISSGVITQTIVECEDGAIKNFPMLTLSLIIGDQASGAAQLEYQDGIFVPAEAEFITKNWVDTWSGNYILHGNFKVQDDEDQMTFTVSDSPMHMNWQTEGVKEAVEVPAGSFPNAIRVERENELNISVQLSGDGDTFNFEGVFTFENTLWYEPNIGLLKEEVHDANIKYRGMTFPVVVTGNLELQEFRPAQ